MKGQNKLLLLIATVFGTGIAASFALGDTVRTAEAETCSRCTMTSEGFYGCNTNHGGYPSCTSKLVNGHWTCSTSGTACYS